MIQHLSQISKNWKLLFRSPLIYLVGLVLTIQFWGLGTAPAQATGVYDMPTLTAGDSTWVIDEADILSRLTETELNGELGSLAQTTGNEVRFVTVHRLDYGETVQSFAGKLFEKWFPTPEAQSNQVLLVLDNVTNSAAIHSGTDAKAFLSDSTADSVAQETVMVPLRNGNKYNQAFLEASDRLVAILSGQPDPGPPVVAVDIQTEGTFAKAEETDDKSATVVVIVLLAVATIVPMATYFLYQAFQS
jgi:uncharacterized protein